MIFWLQFRLRQFIRVLRAAGLGILLVLVVLTMPFWAKGMVHLSEMDIFSMGVIAFIGIGLLHLLRTDHLFLRKGHLSLWQYYVVDYGCLCCLLAFIPLINGHWWTALVAFSGLFWAIVSPGLWLTNKSERQKLSLRWLPPPAFEWRMILRTQWPIWLFLFVLILFCPIHVGFYAVGMVFPAMFLASGYEHLEPYIMRPSNFQAFIGRWRSNARWLYLWLVPTSLYFLFFHPQWWPLVVYHWLNYEAYLALLSIYKYNAWAPGRRRIYGGAITTVGGMSVLMPGGLIVLVGMAIWQFSLGAKESGK